MLDSILHALRWVFLLRVPLLTATAAFVVIPWLALGKMRSLLGSLLDVTPVGMGLITASGIFCAWTSLVAAWVVNVNGPARFGFDFGVAGSLPAYWFVASGLFPSFLLIAAAYHSRRWGERQAGGLIAGILGGALVAAGIGWATLRIYRDFLSTGPAPAVVGSWLTGFSSNITAGYVVDGHAHPSHLLAAVLFAVFLAVYFGLGALKWLLGRQNTGIPTLVYVLLLITLACWFLGETAFFLDRYGVPVLFILAVLLVIGFLSPWTDHRFRTHTIAREKAPFPEDVLLATGADRVVLVAASGGGIQSAAWTARVLTGLELKFREAGQPNVFAKAVRLISSVSGGSVGAMYFSSLYQPGGTIPAKPEEVEQAWHYAAQSSLENVARGIVYGDFLRLLSLFAWWIDGRGRALERSFLRSPELARKLTAKLSDWFAGTLAGDRPSNIFNATLVETGDRLLFSTSHFHADDPDANPQGRPVPTARWEFHSFRPGHDVSIATAARLSASFPYVSPAARPDIGGPFHPELHVVDGGYYDNDGMASLVEWLDQGLRMLHSKGQLNRIRKVMVLMIHGLPDTVQAGSPQGQKRLGWPFQAIAPLEAVLAVRSAAQRANDELLIRLLKERWTEKVEIQALPVDFSSDPRESPPLSWHLATAQKNAIQGDWDRQGNMIFHQVQRFLS